MSEQFDVILGGLDTEVDVTIADSTGVDPSVILALRGEKGDKGDTGAAGQDGTNGIDGTDGISPIATVSKVGDTATIIITDANGTTTATVTDGIDGINGTDGADGYSPTATVAKSGDTATITITDKDGTTTASISDGSGGASAFVAEFGITTYADVKDAYDNDAILICTVDDSGNTMVLQLVYFDATNEIFFFAEPNGDGVYWTELSNANGWDDGTRYLASTDVATQLADGLMSALDKQKLDSLSKRNIWYGTCSTSASSSPKSITTASGDFSLTAGNMLVVLFSHANSLSSASLQVDGGTAKAAYPMDGTSDISNRWGSNELAMFAYDGSKFIMLEQGKASTTAYGITKLNNTVTSTSTSEAATANAVKSAYDNGGVQSVNGSTGAVTVTVPTITDTYDGTSSDGMSGKAVKSAIDALDGTVSGSAGSGKTLTAFSQTDGKVSATFGNISITKSQVSDFPTIPTNVSDLNNDSGFTATSVTRHTTTGTNIADLTIDGTTTKLYAPTGGGGGGITDVTVDGTSVVSGTTAAIDLTGKSDVGHTHTTSAITDFPSLATVATSGSYADLSNKPSIPTITDTYSGTSSDGMSGKAVKSAIDALDGTVTGTAGSGKTLTAFSQTDGKVSATFGSISITKSQVSDFPTLATVATSGSYNDLTDKPTIPTVNNATLTIQKNSTDVATFTANASSNVTADISVPTDTNDLTNGAGFLTASGILNLFYPVGSYYETSDTTFDPNNSWGGTWSLETEGLVHIGAGANYTAGDTGGSADAIIPYHNHSVRAVTGGITGGSHSHNQQGWYGLKSAASGTAKECRARTKISTDPSEAGTNIASTHSHDLPAHDTNYAGTSGNAVGANMQPYIVVNRWHRTA